MNLKKNKKIKRGIKMLFGIMLFILVILSNKNKWYLLEVLIGFWILALMEVAVELNIVYRLLVN